MSLVTWVHTHLFMHEQRAWVKLLAEDSRVTKSPAPFEYSVSAQPDCEKAGRSLGHSCSPALGTGHRAQILALPWCSKLFMFVELNRP